MHGNIEPVKAKRTYTTNKYDDGKCWHPYREQLKDIDTIIRRRYNDCIPNDPVGRALVDQAITRIRYLAKLDKVEDCGLRDAEIFCINYAQWVDVSEYSFKGYDPLKPLKSHELGAAIELTAREKHEWGITYIQSFDVDPEIEAEKAQRRKEQAAASEARRRHKRQIDKAKTKRKALMLAHDFAEAGLDNEQIAKALNAMSIRTPSGRGIWREKMVTELVGEDMTTEEKAEAKRKADAERQLNARIRKLAEREHQRLKAHADMMAQVTLRIMELRTKGESFRAIARTLNEEGAPPLSGKGEWSDMSVKRVYEKALQQECNKNVTPHVPR